MKFTWKKGTGLASRNLTPHLKRLEKYRAHLERVVLEGGSVERELSLLLPFDRSIAFDAEALAKRMGKGVEDVVVVGIGGSSLGTQAVYEALRSARHLKRVHVLDTVSPVRLREVLQTLLAHKSERSYVVCVISKSGTTTETIANAMALEVALKRKHPRCLERFVVISAEGSRLWHRADERGIPTLEIPSMVGGRFSVMSAVGLFPLALAGIDAHAFTNGARQAVQDGIKKGTQNTAQQSAAVTYHFYKRGHNIRDTFVFNPELEALGKWERQLIAENLGKRYDLFGREVRAGITPTVSVGSTDLHSMSQLSIGGPHDKISYFVHAPWARDIQTPARSTFDGIVDHIVKKPFNTLMDAMRLGTMAAYRQNDHPHVDMALERINEQTLGYVLQFWMVEVMYLGVLMRVNTFDQPAVDEYKDVTRRLLGKQ